LRKEYNAALGTTSSLEKQTDKLRNELVAAREQLNATKK